MGRRASIGAKLGCGGQCSTTASFRRGAKDKKTRGKDCLVKKSVDSHLS